MQRIRRPRRNHRALPDPQREVLVLCCRCDLSGGQIADALGGSEGTVRSTVGRALDTLESIISQHR